MNIMKMTSNIINRIVFLLAFSIVGGQSIIESPPKFDAPQKPGQFEHSILTHSKFHMNQGFSLLTSMNGGMSQTTGIYSNFSSYKLSDRLQFNTGIHLIQNQNSLSYSTGPQAGIGYEVGFEYKLSPNSLITFQVANYSNSPIRYRNLSPFNVP